MKIYGIKTRNEVFLTEMEKFNSYSETRLFHFYINGEKPDSTFNSNWVKTEKTPEKIEKKVSQPNINYRYELIDKEMKSDKLPLVFTREEVAEFDKEDYYWSWKEEFRHLRSLYKEVYDKQPDKMEEIEFEYVELAEVEEIKDPSGFSFTIFKDQRWTHQGTTELTSESVEHQMIDKIIFPNIMLNNRPSKLSSKQMYNIIRQYIKQHIDLEVARITSDYNFCFAVEKLIALSDPYEQKTEIMKQNGRPYKSPRYNRRYVKNRGVQVFEMTHTEENYKGYTPIPAMIGENIEDLKEKVDKYCKELIEAINKPLVDCHHCDGRGALMNEEDFDL